MLYLEFRGGPFEEVSLGKRHVLPLFREGRISFIMGVSGSGKTLLAWILYYAPLLALLTYRGVSVGDLLDALSLLTGSRGYLDLVRSSKFSLCSNEPIYAEMLGYNPEAVRRVCVEYEAGRIKLKVMLGERIKIRNVGEDVRKVVEGILGEWAGVAAVPSQLRNSLYSVQLDALKRLTDEVNKLNVHEDDIIARMLSTRLPPLSGPREVDEIAEYAGLLTCQEVIEVSISETNGRRVGYVKLSTGELLRKIGSVIDSCWKDVKLVYIDEAFEGMHLSLAMKLARRYANIAERGIAVILASHRPEALLAKDVERVVDVYVVTYGLPRVSAELEVEAKRRFIIVRIEDLSEAAQKEIDDIFLPKVS